MKFTQACLLSIILLLFGASVGVFGGIVTLYTLHSTTESQVHLLHRPSTMVPTVVLQGIENKQLVGSVYGSVRIVLGESVLPQTVSGSFSVPAGPLLTHKVHIAVPDGMNFVASKRGKKFYRSTSVQARSIAPENRIYFTTQAQALKAGYKE